MKRVIEQIIIAARETPREFFAPIVGAYKGIRREYKMLAYLEAKRHRLNNSEN